MEGRQVLGPDVTRGDDARPDSRSPDERSDIRDVSRELSPASRYAHAGYGAALHPVYEDARAV
jgi:hypothetical protein